MYYDYIFLLLKLEFILKLRIKYGYIKFVLVILVVGYCLIFLFNFFVFCMLGFLIYYIMINEKKIKLCVFYFCIKIMIMIII